MLDLKKRLGALIPSDNARGALQNVLTVEWSGHKTVLVELPPPSGSSTSNDVELLGMGANGRDNDQYGRLSDDEDETVFLHQSENRPARNKRSPKSQKALPTLPERPKQSRLQSNNPFYSPDELEDYSPSYKPTYTSSQSHDTRPTSRRAANHSSFSDAPRSPPTRTWATFGGTSSKPVDPWSASGRNPITSTSPTSSRGTTGSGTTGQEEDPFQ